MVLVFQVKGSCFLFKIQEYVYFFKANPNAGALITNVWRFRGVEVTRECSMDLEGKTSTLI